MPQLPNDSNDDPLNNRHDLESHVPNPATTTSNDKSIFTKLLNAIRIHNIPLVNFIIIGVLGGFLLRLTTKYTGLYMKNSLITIIVTNLVLFGISETLAQTLLSYKPSEPLITFRINRTSNFQLYNNPTTTGPLELTGANGATTFTPYHDNTNNDNDDSDTQSVEDEQEVERFIDYVQHDNESIRSEDGSRISMHAYNPPLNNPTNYYDDDDDDIRPIPELTYFQFNRLAGFMVWGFVMAFAQCWWYKFLQIYAKDPKFIEVLRKVLTDQLFYSPISLFCFFTYGTMILENGSWDDTKDKLNKIYLKTLIINYTVWFPVQFINFLIVPRSLQVPFSSSISVLWNCFLSMRNSAA